MPNAIFDAYLDKVNMSMRKSVRFSVSNYNQHFYIAPLKVASQCALQKGRQDDKKTKKKDLKVKIK